METAYFQQLPDYPRFAFKDARIDGLLPACKVSGWEHFIEIMRRPEHNQAKNDIVYRGQRGFDWHLSSTLSRLYDGGSVPPQHQQDLLAQFRLAMRGRGLDVSRLEDTDVWAFGQHHGLRTPLIDWTKSPYVALFFAFDEADPESPPNPSRAVFCLNMAAVRADTDLADQIFEPIHHENARLVNQAGLFTITPSGSDNIVSSILNNLADNEVIDPDNPNDVAKYISKMHIPNSGRVECLASLRKMNIHHANLFPDAGGASRFCNDWLSRIIESEMADAAAAKRALEKETQKKFDPTAIAKLPIDIEKQIVEILKNTLVGDNAISSENRKDWAPKIRSIYEREAGSDWPNHPSSTARLKVSFRKFFLSNSIDKQMAETCSRRLIGLFRERWMIENPGRSVVSSALEKSE